MSMHESQSPGSEWNRAGGPGPDPARGGSSWETAWRGYSNGSPAGSPEQPAWNVGHGAGRNDGPVWRGEAPFDTAAPGERSIPARSRGRLAVVGGIGIAAIIGLATVLVVNQGGSGASKAGGAKTAPAGFQPTASSAVGDAQQTAEAFLAAWQSGDFQHASQYTDDPAAALSSLTSYSHALNLHGLQLTTGSASGAASPDAKASASASANPSGTVAFSVNALVGVPADSTNASVPAAAGTSAPSGTGGATNGSATAKWSYGSHLTAYEKDGGWWVKWDPSLVAPNLTAGEKVVAVAVAPTASEVTDSAGDDLAGATDPGVRNIAAALKKNAPGGQGTPGIEIELEKTDSAPISGTVDVLSQPVDTGVVKTTLDSRVEAAARAAVLGHADSSMVVIQPSTGDILAVANNDGQNDFALTARVAPGSTNKIVASTALLASGLVSSPSQGVQCPVSLKVNGTVFKNDSGDSEPASTPFLTDFAVSCNDAFAKWYSQIGASTLAQTAQKYYGLNEQWNIGLGEAGPYYTIPSSSSDGELAQELFGQGKLEASPLAMASVATTVDGGSFKQPIVVPGQAQVPATPLPSTVQQDLKEMMHAVTEPGGTAAGVYSGVDSTVYGKTGTADVGATQQKPNSWMVVFDPTLDVAVGCVVLDAGYGASVAGPETAAVLKSLQ